MAEINEIAPLVPTPRLRRQDPRRQRHSDDEQDGEQRRDDPKRPPRDGNGRVDEYV